MIVIMEDCYLEHKDHVRDWSIVKLYRSKLILHSNWRSGPKPPLILSHMYLLVCFPSNRNKKQWNNNCNNLTL